MMTIVNSVYKSRGYINKQKQIRSKKMSKVDNEIAYQLGHEPIKKLIEIGRAHV